MFFVFSKPTVLVRKQRLVGKNRAYFVLLYIFLIKRKQNSNIFKNKKKK